MSTSAPAIPPHTLQEFPNSRSISIANWKITASTNPISNAPQCDYLHTTLGIPLPEMTFGNNYLRLHYKPTGKVYAFSTPEALKGVKKGELGPGDGGVKVGYADKWLQSRTDPLSTTPMPKTVATKPYDWTYTTTYSGHITVFDRELDASDDDLSSSQHLHTSSPSNSPIVWSPADPSDPSNAIDMDELTRPDPILFNADIPLFEDELHDNGSSSLLVRIRVMPTCFFILSRFTLRVDQVLFRTHDTRVYHSFASSPPLLVREVSAWEAPYDRVKRALPRRDDMTPLTDPSFIATVLGKIPPPISQREGAKTGWRALGTTKEIAKLS